MKKKYDENGEAWVSIGDVAKKIDRSIMTIKNWYAWHEEQLPEVCDVWKLPKMRQDLDGRQRRYLKEDELKLLFKFRDAIVYGTLARG